MVYFLFRRRTFFLGLAPVALLLVARPTLESIALGLPFVVAGEAIRIWAAGYIRKLATLTTAGPYALCRNPIYVGMFLVSIGYLAMCSRPAAWIVGVIYFWLFHGGAVLHEEKLLREKFGEAYEAYCREVPRFVPRLRRLTGEGTFSWRQFVSNNEHIGAVATVLLTALFVLNACGASHAPFGWLIATRP